MTDIDPNTNLPQLSEGYFWRVAEDTISIMRSVPAGEWGTEHPAPWGGVNVDSRVIEIPSNKLFRKVEKITQFRLSAGAERILTKQYGEWEYMGTYVGDVCTEPDPVTPENILERTSEVYNEWQAKIARQKLYGNYPPKKLEATND